MNVQNFPLSAKHGGQPDMNPGVFKIEEVSRNNVTLRKISATTNKQRPYGKKLGVFYPGILKLYF